MIRGAVIGLAFAILAGVGPELFGSASGVAIGSFAQFFVAAVAGGMLGTVLDAIVPQ